MVHRFSLRKRRCSIKAEQVEVVSLAASPSPINLSLDESLNAVASEQQEAAAILERLKAEQALLQQKVLKITEELRVKQASRSANVSEYLHLISHTDQAQAFRLKKAFEKKNQYLSSIIGELQRRLESYIRRQQQLDREVGHLQEKDPTLQRLQGARSGYPQEEARPESPLLSEASTTRPNGLLQSELEAQGLSHLSREAQGSFSSPYHNINQPQTSGMPHDAYSVITSFSEDLHDLMGLNFGVKTSRISSLERQHIGYLSILEELTEIKETQLNLDLSFKNIAEQYSQHYTAFEESLQEEKYRSNQLQAQMNDLIDLHQNEVQNLKSELASLEEKIAYQSYESSRDIWEVLESFQSKMTRLEQQQQQGEILDHVNTRELLGKSMNLLLIMFAVVLMLMSTVSAIILPFIKTRARTVSTCVAVVLLILMWHNWEFITAFSPRRLVFRWR
ncbi:transmembrane and coiled-coil domain protein 3-like [Carcharodon carcharias]|uniref:transmembrane and coiled-coil domain protein 3-like n=1 Tax=Carcharodon carcharias TaxID=13397 RepID=UPI001B7F102B|nr:transmembrane and coiled-coil domain protein 3-like [Carcharodon carcharias]